MSDHLDDTTRPLRPYQLKSPVLRAHGLAVARRCFDRIYETWPELDERYGERGRHHTSEDNFWHLEHLDAAAELGDPSLFERYADWLVGLLVARGLDRAHIAGAFGFLADELAGVECPDRHEDHRQGLITILRSNQARVLEA